MFPKQQCQNEENGTDVEEDENTEKCSSGVIVEEINSDHEKDQNLNVSEFMSLKLSENETLDFKDCGTWSEKIIDSQRTHIVRMRMNYIEKLKLTRSEREGRSVNVSGFFKNLVNGNQSLDGFINWKKVSERIPEHENSNIHKKYFCSWKMLEMSICEAMENSAFRGTDEIVSNIGKSNQSGKFLNLVNLISHYNEPLRIHFESQKKGNISHEEPMSQVIRYVIVNENGCEIVESFLGFLQVFKKTGEAITEDILRSLSNHSIDLSYCRGQSYNNGGNMAGKWKGVQARISSKNSLARFIPCTAYSLNLVGLYAAKCSPELEKFFGIVQKLFKFFSSSTQRWDILKEHLKCSLKDYSTTR
ncbi:uncharacterized protein LOC112685953 [Sipha flava]|uniref:Uncharacterized protein LOC112685953 n=1 Tax=Sipha flava TaxID=143950 RepID=A0A8B8FTQ4_9HEMI|nr:uncharacterized protein LOC112685953 [Sipha flava]